MEVEVWYRWEILFVAAWARAFRSPAIPYCSKPGQNPK